MLHDIFKNSHKKEEEKGLIVIDIHEKNSLVIAELKSSSSVNIEIKSLPVADYVIGEVVIERKTVNDFISSMINRRLMKQLNQIKEYKKSLLIIEGDTNNAYQKKDTLAKAMKGLILSILLHWNIPIIMTKDCRETAEYLIILAKQQIKKKSMVSLHAKIPKTILEQKKYILEAFPHIGQKKATILLEKFKTLKAVVNAPEEELALVLKNHTKEFKDLLNA